MRVKPGIGFFAIGAQYERDSRDIRSKTHLQLSCSPVVDYDEHSFFAAWFPFGHLSWKNILVYVHLILQEPVKESFTTICVFDSQQTHSF